MSSPIADLSAAIKEIFSLCALGDVDDDTEAYGWGNAIENARSALLLAEDASLSLLRAAKLAERYLTCDSTPLSNDFVAGELAAAIARAEGRQS